MSKATKVKALAIDSAQFDTFKRFASYGVLAILLALLLNSPVFAQTAFTGNTYVGSPAWSDQENSLGNGGGGMFGGGMLGGGGGMGGLSPMGAVLCNVVGLVLGDIGRGLATLSVIVVGIGAMLGKVSWGMAMTVAVGIAVVFGAPEIVGLLGVNNGGCRSGGMIVAGGWGGGGGMGGYQSCDGLSDVDMAACKARNAVSLVDSAGDAVGQVGDLMGGLGNLR